MKKHVVDRYDQNDPLDVMGARFGLKHLAYRSDTRLQALLAFKIHLDGAIAAARRAYSGKVDVSTAKRKQQSKTKAALLPKIMDRYGFTERETQPGPLADLIEGAANSMVYLALLRKPTAKTKVSTSSKAI